MRFGITSFALVATVWAALVSGCFYGRTPETKHSAYVRNAIPIVLGALFFATAQGLSTSAPADQSDSNDWITGVMLGVTGTVLVIDGLVGMGINAVIPLDSSQ
jgi:hypothetical protein